MRLVEKTLATNDHSGDGRCRLAGRPGSGAADWPMGGGEYRRGGGGADGALSGSAGCYRLMGRADISGQTTTFGPVATTRMACASTVMDQERRLLDALTSTRSYRIADSVLTLHDGSGVELVRLA